MKTFPHLVHKLFFSPLLVLPSTYATFERGLLQRMGLPFDETLVDPFARVGDNATAPEAGMGPGEQRLATPQERKQARVNRVLATYGSVAVISIDGVIDKRLSDSEINCYGGVDLNDIDSAIEQVSSDPRVKKVVFDFNTPGGSAAGVPETAELIRQLGDFKNAGGGGKETHARVELLCASAGQWLASQCFNISAAPSATLGSVGVYSAYLDQTGWLEQNGLKVNLIKAGKFKAMGANFKAMEDDERTMIQGRVNDLWAEFKTAVREARDVTEESLQGQTFTAKDAKKRGLCDEVWSGSLDEYVAELM